MAKFDNYLLFDGSETCPYQDATYEAMIWGAEQFCYEYHISDQELVSYVAAFVGKWDPWCWSEVIDRYMEERKARGI